MEAPPSYEAAMAENNTQPIVSLGFSDLPSSPFISSMVPSLCTLPSGEPSSITLISNLPSAPPAPPNSFVPQEMLPAFGILDDESVRDAFYKYAEKNFKNGSSIVEHMSFSSKRSCYSLHYKLETFLERRDSVIKNCKYDGKEVDGPKNGPEPNIRCIFVVCREKFQNGETHVVIPHSEHLRRCQKCDDRGKEICLTCKGAGWNPCHLCGNNGYLKDKSPCLDCSKSGRLLCDPCYSSGRTNCRECNGYKKLKSYKELIVTWMNHIDEYDINPTELPTHLLKSSSGCEIFKEESLKVQPLTMFPEAAINVASLKLVFKHQRDCDNKVVLLQRHSVRAIPITKINYNFKGKIGECYLYGTENSMYFENYPDILECID